MPPFDATVRQDAPPTAEVIDAATARIAPAWPLDRLAAVNPFWGLVDQPIEDAFAQVGALAGSRLLMPRSWYSDQWSAGLFRPRHIEAALAARGSELDARAVTRALNEDDLGFARRALITDVADQERNLSREMGWTEFVVGQLSQLCASYFGADSAANEPSGLYREWHEHARRDRAPELLMELEGVRAKVEELPAEPRELTDLALDELAVPAYERTYYLSALLMDVNGWASWCAYRRWTARLADSDDAHIDELLAVRLAWELLLFRTGDEQREAEWRRAMADWPRADGDASDALELEWVLQEALELAYQETVTDGLRSGTSRERPTRPSAQAAFCIDVRSEIIRRGVERASDGGVRTLGFAGFFGLPIEYRAVGTETTIPQLPGLLSPSLQVTDGADPALAQRRGERLGRSETWRSFKKGAASTFSFVESTGLFYAAKLIGHTLGLSRPEPSSDLAGLSASEHAERKPRLTGAAGDGDPIGLDTRVDVAEGILRGMSLTEVIAPIVALVGHGSATTNNPVAAGLDCGACCGQSGEVNARAVAALLNDPSVRTGLSERGIDVPEDTHFVPGLHNTTTDEVTLLDRADVPDTHSQGLAQLEQWLASAAADARRERAPSLRLEQLDDEQLRRAIERRTNDWSEVRPEWGLAGNAAFIVAPRERCDHLDLGGRSFLHEYRWQEDEGFGVLEGLMTAPMVVTHWINLQYYASTVDNHRFGSGNKVLHNVVGGHIGVFEGNGGDLRVGLPLQCLHDGESWVHTPLRLSVFIDAPQDALEGIIDKHAVVRDLVTNGWLHLFQIHSEEGSIYRYRDGGWVIEGPTDPES